MDATAGSHDGAYGPDDGYRPGPIERTERGDAAFAHAKRHSRRVRALKIVLPTIAVIMVAVFVGYSMLSSTIKRVADLGSLSIDGGGVVMANPKLEGFTEDDLPYSLHADEARQPLNGDGAINLKGISASVPIDSRNRASISAASGSFNRDKNTLVVDSPITLDSTSGLSARLRSANIDIGKNALTTDEPVDIKLDGMHIAADAMKAAQGGKTLTFQDRVRVQIDPARLNRDGKQGDGSKQ